MEMEGPSKSPRTPLSQCVLSSLAIWFSQTSRGYACALIVHSRAVDPRRTATMMEKEESVRQHFEELKDVLPKLCPHLWKQEFKSYIDEFITERLCEKDIVTAIPAEDEEEEERDRIFLHGLQRLVAGAAQELELVQQPKHAAKCAELDNALVWQGRGYVSSIMHDISSLQSPLQSEFEKVPPTLWLVIPQSFYKLIYLFSPVDHS